MASDFFVSYTGADQGWAEWIAWQLEAEGYTTVIQAWDFTPGSDWVHQMQNAAKDSKRTIAVLSDDYFRSAHGEAEWRAAYADDPTGEKGMLVPVRVAACEPPGLLKTRVFADLVGLDEETARAALVRAVKEGRVKPTIEPSFPGRATPRFPRAPAGDARQRRAPSDESAELARLKTLLREHDRNDEREAVDEIRRRLELNSTLQRETVYRIGSSRFRVQYGDLTVARADVLVSSDDNHLSMGGGISMAISRAGGPEVAAHARKLIPLRAGDVGVTTAGLLKSKYVFHAVTIDVDERTYPDAACIDKLVRRALELADVLEVPTIAFPALGTGLGGFPFEEAADVMTRALTEHLAGDTTVEDVSLILRAQPGVAQKDLELFYERVAGYAAVVTQSERLAGAIAQLRQVGLDADIPVLTRQLEELERALDEERARFAARPRSRQDIDAIERASALAEIGARTVEVTSHSGRRFEAQSLEARLEGLGTQLNVLTASLNRLEIEKAGYGGLGVPPALEQRLDALSAEIARVQQTMQDVRGQLAALDPPA